MDDLFKKLYKGEKLPEDLKKEVMKSYDTIKMIGDIADLFTDKFMKTEIDFFSKSNTGSSEKEEE